MKDQSLKRTITMAGADIWLKKMKVQDRDQRICGAPLTGYTRVKCDKENGSQ
jgi:hypothetical protein